MNEQHSSSSSSVEVRLLLQRLAHDLQCTCWIVTATRALYNNNNVQLHPYVINGLCSISYPVVWWVRTWTGAAVTLQRSRNLRAVAGYDDDDDDDDDDDATSYSIRQQQWQQQSVGRRKLKTDIIYDVLAQLMFPGFCSLLLHCWLYVTRRRRLCAQIEIKNKAKCAPHLLPLLLLLLATAFVVVSLLVCLCVRLRLGVAVDCDLSLLFPFFAVHNNDNCTTKPKYRPWIQKKKKKKKKKKMTCQNMCGGQNQRRRRRHSHTQRHSKIAPYVASLCAVCTTLLLLLLPPVTLRYTDRPSTPEGLNLLFTYVRDVRDCCCLVTKWATHWWCHNVSLSLSRSISTCVSTLIQHVCQHNWNRIERWLLVFWRRKRLNVEFCSCSCGWHITKVKRHSVRFVLTLLFLLLTTIIRDETKRDETRPV